MKDFLNFLENFHTINLCHAMSRKINVLFFFWFFWKLCENHASLAILLRNISYLSMISKWLNCIHMSEALLHALNRVNADMTFWNSLEIFWKFSKFLILFYIENFFSDVKSSQLPLLPGPPKRNPRQTTSF